MVTNKQRNVFFDCVSKCLVIYISKLYTNVRLCEHFFNYKMYALLHNWHEGIKLTVM